MKLCLRCRKPIDKANPNYRKMVYCSLPCFKETLRKSPEQVIAENVTGGAPSECWLWTGRKDKSGYGRVQRKGPYTYAHRIAWTIANGPVPDGMDVLHHCDVRNCCNPAHLWLGTHEDNMKDMHRKGRGSTKLKPEQVREIRQALAGITGKKVPSGTYQRLAAKYGVTDKQIWTIRTGRQWTDVQ